MKPLLSSTVARWSATLLLLVASALPVAAQDWNFTHDASGNTTARTAAASSLPQIVGQPQPQVVAPGDVATFSVVLSNSGGATFQWRYNSTDIGGATSDSLVIASVVAGDAGAYSVVVTNGAGSVPSADAALLIDNDEDGLPDSWEQTNFGNLNQTATGDLDNDGVSNLDEFRDGTNPNSNSSFNTRLTVLTDGGGNVTISPWKTSYNQGDVVTLTAAPFSTNTFHGWSGALTTRVSPETLTMSASKTVKAHFIRTPIPAGAVSWWRAENNALDAVGNNNGALVNGVSFASGQAGQAFNFTAAAQHVKVNASPALHVGSGSGLTVEAWIKPDDLTERPIAEWHTGSGSAWGAHFWTSVSFSGLGGAGCLYTNLKDINNVDHYLFSPTGLLSTTAWQHVAVTYDRTSGTTRLFLNGAVVASANLGSFVPNTTSDLYLGYRPGGTAPTYSGLLDEPALYGRALAVDEIGAIHASGPAGKSPAPFFTSPSQLPDAVLVTSYAYQLTTALGTNPLSYSLASGTLPPGLTLSPGGLISGAPGASGNFVFPLRVTDATGLTRDQTFTLKVLVPVAPPHGILAWWRGEPDVSGQAIDHIAARNGSFFQTNTPSTAQHTAGKVGSAFSFVTTTNLHARIADTAALRPAQVTMEAWIYPTLAPNDYRAIVARGSASSYHDTWYLGTRNGSIDFFSEHTNATSHLLNSPAVPLNEWTHVVGTFDGSTKALYINGVRVALAPNLGPLVYVGSAPVTIGSDWESGGPAAYFRGLIDEVTLYNRALTTAEIRTLSEASGAGKSLTGPYSIDLGEIAIHQPITASLTYPAGVAPVNFSLLTGQPPPGISLLTSGAFDGTSPTSGEFSFTVRATAANSAFIDLIPSVRLFRPADRPAGLISWWRAENDMQDAIGANHGTNFGATTYPAGKVGKTFGFNGSSNVIIADSPSLRPASFTFEAWVNYSTYGGLMSIAGKPYGTGIYNSWALFQNGTGLNVGFSPTADSFQAFAVTLVPEIGRWYHFAYVFEAGVSQRLYIDGVRVGTQPVSSPLIYDTHPMLIGRDTQNGTPIYFFNGTIDEAAFYNRAATDSEIAAIYAAGVAGKALPGFGDSEDRDGDELTNFLEYGLNTNPGVFNAGASPTLITDPYGDQLAVSLVRDPAKSDVTLIVESSGDLRDWVAIATSRGGNEFAGIATILGETNGNAPRTVTIVDPYFGNTGFLRVSASR